MNRDEENVAQLCVQLHRKAAEYEEAVGNRARADVAYRQARAERILRALDSQDATSVAKAEVIADADPKISRLRLDHLITDGVCDGLTKSMIALRTRVDAGRTFAANQRQVDALMATSREVP